MRQVEHVRNNENYACEARDIVDGVNANYTEGFVKRKAVLSTGADASINVILTLNGFGFFTRFVLWVPKMILKALGEQMLPD